MEYLFKPQTFWMHNKFKDVCIEVLKIDYSDNTKIKLKIRYWNIGYTGNPYPMDIIKNSYTILSEDCKDWVRITKDDLLTPRTNSGLPNRYYNKK